MGGGISKHGGDEAAVRAASAVGDQPGQPPQSQPPPQPPGSEPDAGDEPPASKCPMHKADGSGYSYDWKQLFRAAAVHGPGGSKPLSEKERAEATGATGGGSACPVVHDPAAAGGGCPVRAPHPEYDVYSQPIDKTNNMPRGASVQLPNASQRIELSTERVSSTIPKGGADGSSAATWTYPSPQQFYNALARKGKFDANGGESEVASEEDMASVVALHNNMNEKTWAKVVEWERQTYSEASAPKLLRFCGRPHDLSPKAALKHYLLGHPLPYDRHDWTVLRDDGSTVRYVIDYYYDESRAGLTDDSAMPDLHDRSATPSLLVDVRPALDGPGSLLARGVRMPYRMATGQTGYEMLPLRGTPELADQVKESVEVWKSIQQTRARQEDEKARKEAAADDDGTAEGFDVSEDRAREIALGFARALEDCSGVRERMANCSSEDECSRASMDLTLCFGKHLCSVQHKSLLGALEKDGDDAKAEAALETLTQCVMLKSAERRFAREQHPGLFEERE
ncbi:unnamed protein product [Pseudo-nitzschia multistriata]|uniref:Holocytochrome c-type synthase n=1 Tax=Pseudo-nitzschia multistriata TaxID=183589 RepID=A0A448ZCM5_9STRA|nr:unnamed protein product [Pseudo-nitzschia multistriata]